MKEGLSYWSISFTQKCNMTSSESNIPMIDQASLDSENLGVGIYSSLMGTFDLPALVNYIGLTIIGNITYEV